MAFPKLIPVLVLLSLTFTCWAGTLRQVGMLDLPGRPGFDSVAIANSHLVIAHPGAGTVDIFELNKRRLVKEFKEIPDASGVATDDSHGLVFVASNSAKTITLIDSRTWETKGTIQLPAAPDRITYVPELDRIYTVNGRDQSVSAVELKTSSVATTQDVGGTPEQVVYDPVRKALMVTLQDTAQVIVLDPGLKKLAEYPLKGSQPTGIALNSETRRLYVSVRNAVLTLNADTGAEVARAKAPSGVDSLWLDRDSGSLYAAAGGSVCILKTGSSGASADVELPTEVKGYSLAFDPANKLIYLPGGREGKSKLLILREMEGRSPTAVGKKNNFTNSDQLATR